VVPPDDSQNSAEQEENRKLIPRLDGGWVWEEKTADYVCSPISFLHISCECALPYLQFFRTTEEKVPTRLHVHFTDAKDT
jgi:hypothetical protein